jgi:hypothetical protein
LILLCNMCNAHNLLLNIYVYIYINILLWIHLFLLYLTCFLLNMTSMQLAMPPFHSFPCLLIAHHTVLQHCREMRACISDSLQWQGSVLYSDCLSTSPTSNMRILTFPISQLLMQGCGYEAELLNTWTKYSRVYVIPHHLVLSIKSGYNFWPGVMALVPHASLPPPPPPNYKHTLQNPPPHSYCYT